jgi:hypothetical protein
MRRMLIGMVVVAAALGAAAAPAGAKTKWLCRPGLAKNPCTPSLSTTLFSGWDSRVGVISPRRASHPKADCFFVYPTVSNQKTTFANLRIDPELRSIALYQVSRYSQYCRVFAPVYRQVTVPALVAGKYTAGRVKTAYHHGVVAAWRDYLVHFNHGRPFVVIGHSQGSTDVQRLVREQIEGKPRLLRRLLSAIALGGNVTVKAGSDVGGSFRRVRACHSATQLHCAIAFSTYEDVPPPDAGFGRAVANALTVGRSGPGYPVLCTNPAALGGGTAQLDSISPTAPFAPNTLIAAGIAALGVQFPQAPTTYVEARGAFSGRCETDNGATVLRIQSLGNSPVFKPSPTAQFGLHLVDANIALGDLVRVVKTEIAAYRR